MGWPFAAVALRIAKLLRSVTSRRLFAMRSKDSSRRELRERLLPAEYLGRLFAIRPGDSPLRDGIR
ncbi:MAG TPA: hypothetical protein VFW15_04460 [Thermoanaerobaculia bacterium]|nr:hypothetical protein [Thermoanaerobaculia bacterium]